MQSVFVLPHNAQGHRVVGHLVISYLVISYLVISYRVVGHLMMGFASHKPADIGPAWFAQGLAGTQPQT